MAAFLLVSMVLIATPGQDTLLTIRNTVVGGRAGGLQTAVGVAAGQLSWATAMAIGVGGILTAMPSAIAVLTLAGAAYLVYLGTQYVRDASRELALISMPGRLDPSAARLTFFRQGLVSNLSNPKMLLFFTSLLPSFGGEATGLPLPVLGAVFSLLTLGWLTCYAAAVAMLGDFLARTGVRRAVNLVAGTTLLIVGVSIAAATHL